MQPARTIQKGEANDGTEIISPVIPRRAHGQVVHAQAATQHQEGARQSAPLALALLRTRAGTVGLLLLALVLVRLALSLTYPAMMGVDGGAYLDQVLHRTHGFGAAAFVRLPLGPGYTLTPFIHLFGINTGYKVWGAIAAAFPLVPACFLLFQRYLSRNQALWVTAIACGGWTITEMEVTGSLPLVGFGWLLFTMWGLHGLITQGNRSAMTIGWRTWYEWRYQTAIVSGIPLIAFTDHAVAGVSAIVLPLWTVTLWMYYRSVLHELATTVLVGLGCACFALPWYPQVGFNSAIYHYPGPWLFLRHTPYDVGWYVSGLAFAGAFLAWREGKDWKAVAVVLGVLAVISPWYSFDESVVNVTYRSRYFLALLIPLGFAPLFVRWWPRFPRITRSAYAAAAIGMLLAGTAISHYEQQRSSTFVNPDVEAALSMVNASPLQGSILTSNFGEGTWYQALTGRPIFYTFNQQPPRAYTETDAAIKCIWGWVQGCDVAAAIALTDARFVVVNAFWPEGWGANTIWGAPGDGKSDVFGGFDMVTWLTPVFQQGKVRVWQVN
jgi:hypothetical protein